MGSKTTFVAKHLKIQFYYCSMYVHIMRSLSAWQKRLISQPIKHLVQIPFMKINIFGS